MRIALIGTGRMGTAVTRLAVTRGHELSALFSSTRTAWAAGAETTLREADVAIDFSTAAAVPSTVKAAVRAGLPIVIGTTGWHDRADEIREIVRAGDGTMLSASNFSLGVALLSQAVRAVAPLLNRLNEFDIYVAETHHVHKIDSPSGTALHLGGIIIDEVDRKTGIRTTPNAASTGVDELQIASTRAGAVFGIHEVHVDGPNDHISLTHEAKNRDGFAGGALVAAEWLVGRQGIFTLDDMINDLSTSIEKTPREA